MRCYALFLLATAGASPLRMTQVKGRDGAIPVLTVCEVLSAPQRYNGRTVRVRGMLSGTDEGAWFYSNSCEGAFTTADHIWPSVISLARPPLSLGFKFDKDSERRLPAKFKRLRKSAPETCMLFTKITYTGIFETRGREARLR